MTEPDGYDHTVEVRPENLPEDYATVRASIASWLESTTARERQGGTRDLARDLAVRAQLVALTLQGLSYAEIARRYGYADASGVRHVVLRSIRQVEAENRADLVATESARLDRAVVALWPKVLAGDTKAHDSWLRNRARYARLHGLDAPVQVTISAGVQAELQDAIREAEAVLGTVVNFPTAADADEPPALEA